MRVMTPLWFRELWQYLHLSSEGNTLRCVLVQSFSMQHIPKISKLVFTISLQKIDNSSIYEMNKYLCHIIKQRIIPKCGIYLEKCKTRLLLGGKKILKCNNCGLLLSAHLSVCMCIIRNEILMSELMVQTNIEVVIF